MNSEIIEIFKNIVKNIQSNDVVFQLFDAEGVLKYYSHKISGIENLHTIGVSWKNQNQFSIFESLKNSNRSMRN
mgnify:CR=1 FL=1